MRISDWSSDVCSSDLDAAVDPSAGPRRSTMTVVSPASDSASAINAPDTPAPTTIASHAISRVKGLDEIAGRRRADQIDRPGRRSRGWVAAAAPIHVGDQARSRTLASRARMEERLVGEKGVSQWRSRWYQ